MRALSADSWITPGIFPGNPRILPGFGYERPLPGRTTDGTSICRDCAGITTNMTCGGCGTETERFRAGQSTRCVPRTDLEGLLHPHSPGPEPQTPHRADNLIP